MKFKFLKKTTLLSVTSLCILIFTPYLQAQYNDFDLPERYKTISLEDEPNEQDLNSLSDAINTNNFDQVISLIESKKILAKSDDSQGTSFVKKAFEAFYERKFVDPRILIYLVIKGGEISAKLEAEMNQSVRIFKSYKALTDDAPKSMNLNEFINNLNQASSETNTTEKAGLLYDAIFYASPFFAEPVEKTELYTKSFGFFEVEAKVRKVAFGKNPQTLEAIATLKQKVLEEYDVEDIADREEEDFTFLGKTQAEEDEDFVMIEDTQETKTENGNDEFSTERDEDDDLSDWTVIENKEVEEPSWWEKTKAKFNR